MYDAIEDQLAIAMVRGGVSLDDFERLTTEEWQAVATQIAKREEQEDRRSWEQTRQLFYASVAPHIERTDARSLFPLPWDEETTQQVAQDAQLSEEDIETMKSRFGVVE